jgi:hypothetical protein
MDLVEQAHAIPWSVLGPMIWLGYILTILMIVDCAINRRDIYWFVILVILGPLGGFCYLIYHFEHITFPFRVARLRDVSRSGRALPKAARRCSRCGSVVPRVVPFQDARSILFVCERCNSELEASRRS